MKKLLTLLLAVFMISAVIFITACEDKHTELPAITISSTSKELPPKTTTKENVETTSPVLKEPIESSNVKKTVYYRDDGTISSEYEYNENGYIISETLYDTDGKNPGTEPISARALKTIQRLPRKSVMTRLTARRHIIINTNMTKTAD